jgi:hypothetical protein
VYSADCQWAPAAGSAIAAAGVVDGSQEDQWAAVVEEQSAQVEVGSLVPVAVQLVHMP